MKNFVNILVFALVSAVTLPALAKTPPSTPKTPADCQKVHAGDEAKIQACIDGLKH
ncbi:MAG: hypothetical protein ABIR84_13935 [Candidatus Nitrotoga sp.]